MWVFGYGSLLWNPGFTPVQTVKACLMDYHRSFCMLSIHHRGTEDDPGLVLALDAAKGHSCTGIAFQVHANEEESVLAALRERELISSAYYESHVDVQTDDGTTLTALTYIIDPDHVQYCQFNLEKQAQMSANATGGRGPNTEYLYNTAAQLKQHDIPDADMDWLVDRVRALTAT